MTDLVVSEEQPITRRDRLSGLAIRAWEEALPFALGAGTVGGLAAASGGYFPPAWGWASLALLWVAAAGARRPPSHRSGTCGARARRGAPRSARLDRPLRPVVRERDQNGLGDAAPHRLRGGRGRGPPRRPQPRGAALPGRDPARDHRCLELRARHAALPRAFRNVRLARRLPARRSARVLERARDLRGARDPARRRTRGPRAAPTLACPRRGERRHPRADVLLHLQPWRLDRARARPDRHARARCPPAPARDDATRPVSRGRAHGLARIPRGRADHRQMRPSPTPHGRATASPSTS